MTATTPDTTPAAGTDSARRLVVYAITEARGTIDAYVPRALAALRAHAATLVLSISGSPDEPAIDALRGLVDAVHRNGPQFDPGAYSRAITAHGGDLSEFDEVLLTGDAWFGPVTDLTAVFDRMAPLDVDFWEMTENRDGLPRAFPEEGFPARVEAWAWTLVRRAVFTSDVWSRYWASARADHDPAAQEHTFAGYLREAGMIGAAAFAAERYGTGDPAVFAADQLIADGCPILRRRPFTLYPPLLHQRAVIGREILADLEATGYPIALVRQHLARTVAPKALNTAVGLLEVVPAVRPGAVTAPSGQRIVAIVHVTDMDYAEDLFRNLSHLPAGYDLVVTTVNGRKGSQLTRLLEANPQWGHTSFDVRVTPVGRGRDMSDFFVACRDVLLGDQYDIVVKVHSRAKRRKTMNVRRYFRRYQLENLLGSREHVAQLLGMFEREPGLGLVFPPMMHIGYSTMGRAWAGYRDAAVALAPELGIHVPTDRISPLAPFGGMWIGRPEALRPIAAHRWQYRDYGSAGRRRFRDLARLQERLVVAAAAELGYHSRTVLTPSHASVSYTALEFKADELFSTTTGYPVDSIELLHRAGRTGHGGIVGLSRMYLRLNHRLLSRITLPALDLAEWAYVRIKAAAGDERFVQQLRDQRRERR